MFKYIAAVVAFFAAATQAFPHENYTQVGINLLTTASNLV